MRLRAPWPAGALLAALTLLSGCVAAAIPALAAGGVLKTRIDRKSGTATPTAEPRVPIDISSPARTQGGPAPAATTHSYSLPNGTRMEVMTGRAAPGPALAPPPASVGRTYTLADGTGARVLGGALPPPSEPGAAPVGFTGYDAFYAFADAKGALPVVGNERRSAMLAAPGTLAPETSECSVHPAAVLIDLDPGAGVLDPAAATHADPLLARALAALRAEGIAVAWLSANTADRAGAIRRALKASGLDPEGKDELALLRYPEERKQTRREDLAKQFCVVAIAGDERSDFDELFQYLKDPAAAAPLEPLIGKGWFLIPQPLS